MGATFWKHLGIKCIFQIQMSTQKSSGFLASLRELQSATGEELSALLPSVLDKAFKGEL